MPSGQCKGGRDESPWVRLKLRLPAYWLGNLLGLQPWQVLVSAMSSSISCPLYMSAVKNHSGGRMGKGHQQAPFYKLLFCSVDGVRLGEVPQYHELHFKFQQFLLLTDVANRKRASSRSILQQEHKARQCKLCLPMLKKAFLHTHAIEMKRVKSYIR
ncbi:hypothetical protein Tco_0788738 [Tanacetum coccineum]